MSDTPGKHLLLTGPITGSVTKKDGTEVDVTPPFIYVDTEAEAEEISFLIGEHWVEHGHPDDVDDDGVQRPFEHKYNKRKFNKHPSKFAGKPAGTPRKD